VLRAANEISADAGWRVRIRLADLMHVAYALELGVDQVVTCDQRQATVSQAVGLNTHVL
jgi:hypothetical protein